MPVLIETSGGYLEVAVSEENLVDIETLEANSNDSELEETDDPNYNTPAKGPSATQPPLVIQGTPALASPPKTYFGMVPGSLRKAFLGNLDGSSLVFQVIAIEKLPAMNCYRASLSDGRDIGYNCMFYTNLTQRVKALIGAIENAVFPFISITEYDILSYKFIAIAEFKFMKTFPDVVGNPQRIEDDFYKHLVKGLKNLPNDKKMRGILARNIPTSKRKRLPEAEIEATPFIKKMRTKRRLL